MGITAAGCLLEHLDISPGTSPGHFGQQVRLSPDKFARMMDNVNAKTVGLVAGLGGLAFIGYCIYFDRKRRSDPDFKRRLREKRKQAGKLKGGGVSGPALPDFSDQEAVQRFFLQEVQLWEQLLAQGDIETGVEYLSLAVAVCGQPHALLGVLQQTLPPQIYQLLLQNLDSAQKKVRAHAASSITGLMRGGPPAPTS